MPRPCSMCAHPRRAEIDAYLAASASLDDVIARFGLPSRSALQRHRASHLGRAVTFHLPLAASAPSVVPSSGGLDTGAALDRLFVRAAASPDRTLQDWVRLTLDGLGHVYAAAATLGDHEIAVRALRELRALLQFHALVHPDKLRAHPGWREPPQARDSVFDLERLLLADLTGATGEVADALAALDERHPGFAAEWTANEASRASGSFH